LGVPTALSFDYSYNCIPLVDSFVDLRNLWTLATYSGLACFLSWIVYQWPLCCLSGQTAADCCQDGDANDDRRESLAISYAWFLLPFLPYSQVFFYAESMLAERVLYLPSVGFCLLLAYFLHRGYENGLYTKKTFVCVCVVILLCYSATTYQRNPVWDNDTALSQRYLVVSGHHETGVSAHRSALPSDQRDGVVPRQRQGAPPARPAV
jgi:hypothetical protein